MPKRTRPTRKTRRSKKGQIIAQPSAFDHGTPEIQGRRRAVLGASANLLPLSADNPVDILTARGFLTSAHNQAARDYQRVHAIVYGASVARCAALDVMRGAGLSARARLVAQRQLAAWTALVERGGRTATNAFSRYVIAGYSDTAIVAWRHGRAPTGLEDLARLDQVRDALQRIVDAPPVRVSEDEVTRAEIDEVCGRDGPASVMAVRWGPSVMTEAPMRLRVRRAA